MLSLSMEQKQLRTRTWFFRTNNQISEKTTAVSGESRHILWKKSPSLVRKQSINHSVLPIKQAVSQTLKIRSVRIVTPGMKGKEAQEPLTRSWSRFSNTHGVKF